MLHRLTAVSVRMYMVFQFLLFFWDKLTFHFYNFHENERALNILACFFEKASERTIKTTHCLLIYFEVPTVTKTEQN